MFYVKDVFGLKVENERKLATLRRALEAALEVAEAPGGGGVGHRAVAGRV